MIRTRPLVVLGVVVLLCVVGLSGRANVVAPAPAVKWEYKVVHVVNSDRTYQDELNKAGTDGWELASVMGTGRAGYVFLKRPKQ